MTDDEIKRAIDDITQAICRGDNKTSLRTLAVALETLRAQRWISVEDELPETSDSVMISVNGKIGRTEYESAMMIGSYCRVDGWMIDDIPVDYDKDNFTVEAWRKLPEIYGGSEE